MSDNLNGDNLLVTNIQRFSLHDGPGIRTTVFLKGCNLHCPWCANPENISSNIECYFEGEEKKGEYGKWMTWNAIYEEVKKDKLYYGEDGGITCSGGEPLLWMNQLVPLLQQLKVDGISSCVETALFVTPDIIESALKFFDLFIVDVKLLDEARCKEIIGGNLNQFFENWELLKQSNKKYICRVPLIQSYTTDSYNIKTAARFIHSLNCESVELIKGHNLAEKKYYSLKRNSPQLENLSEENLKEIVGEFNKFGIEPSICKI